MNNLANAGPDPAPPFHFSAKQAVVTLSVFVLDVKGLARTKRSAARRSQPARRIHESELGVPFYRGGLPASFIGDSSEFQP
jgi:hypothetical protein